MTNQDFTSIASTETQFIEALNKLFVHWYGDKKGGAFTHFQKTDLGRYLWKVQDIVSEIDQNIKDIMFADKMLLAFDPGNSVLKKDENAAHAIRYHYENYILRTTKIKDLCLSLINQVMRFGIKRGLSMESQIPKLLDPKYGEFPIIWDYMKTLTDHIKPYRNHLAHNGTVKHKDLALLNAHYSYDIKHENIVNEFRYEASMTGLQRELIEKFTAQIKAYLSNSDHVLKMIFLYLCKPFIDNMQTLVNEHSGN